MRMTTTPSPVPALMDHLSHTYQTTSEGSDHSLLGHSHQCLCPNEHPDSPTPVGDHCLASNKLPHSLSLAGHAHLNVINQLSHAAAPGSNHPHSLLNVQSMHVRASIHASPKSNSRLSHIPKSSATAACTCHLQTGSETAPPEIHEASIVQNRKLDADDSIEVSPLPPALPPRPPPRQRTYETGGAHGSMLRRGRLRDGSSVSHDGHGGGIRKYVFWCCACGGLSTVIGALFLAVYFMLRSYTSTLGYFETIPTFVPATMLMLTGLCVMSLARRRNRFSYLIKVSGVCCLVCALTCVLVTITTTVIHMNRLQTLRECVYTQKTRTCTCYSVLLEAHAETDEGTRFVFDSTPDCEVIHGALYSCLRAMFGLSVSGILVCIFSCMLVYQLLSHERKKMYWEQLELRCRSLYQHQTTTGPAPGSMRGPPVTLGPNSAFCSCCEECRYTPVPANPHMYPWDAHALDRFWTPGRIGNFYSPNPGEEVGSSGTIPSSLFVATSQATGINADGSVRVRDSRNSSGGWNWRRLPWNRGGCPEQTRAPNSMSYPPAISSPDSQYGFSSAPGVPAGAIGPTLPSRVVETITANSGSGGYTVLADRPPAGSYLWGPPPPYSNPDSPARRGLASPNRYQHPHHHLHHQHTHSTHCQLNEDNQTQPQAIAMECQHRVRSRPPLAHFPNKDNYENTTEPETHQISNESSENTDNSNSDRISNTLPVRKTKKRIDISSVKSVTSGQNFRTNIQNVFTNTNCSQHFDENSERQTSEDHNYQEPNLKTENIPNTNTPESINPNCRFLPRLQGVENPAFQTQENTTSTKQEPTESEVYFADVSSCCNISVRNDGQDSSLYDEAVEGVPKPRLISLQCAHSTEKEGNTCTPSFKQENNVSSCTVTDDEDYLAQRIGKRQMSTRSRLPFPLPSSDEHNMDLSPEACLQLLPKDISQTSLCSSVQTPLTETTDDAVTPLSPSFPQSDCCLNFYPETNLDIKAHPRHRTFSNASVDNEFLAPDAQYEVIQQNSGNINYQRHGNTTCSNLTTTISGLNNFGNQSFGSQSFTHNQNVFPSNSSPNSNFSSNVNYNQSSPKIVPPKSLSVNLSNSPRKNIGSNISTLIQNLGGNPVGLLYGEVNSGEDEEIQAQGSHSDATMDSGWQSGSDRPEGKRGDSPEETTQRSVNV